MHSVFATLYIDEFVKLNSSYGVDTNKKSIWFLEITKPQMISVKIWWQLEHKFTSYRVFSYATVVISTQWIQSKFLCEFINLMKKDTFQVKASLDKCYSDNATNGRDVFKCGSTDTEDTNGLDRPNEMVV